MPILHRLTSTLSLAVVIWIALNQVSVAQRKGDRVVVTANFDTKIRSKRVGKVFGGSLHTVLDVNGKWLALDQVKGWLPAQYVMGLDRALKHYTARIAKNDADADAWRFRGMIYLENNELPKAFFDMDSSLRRNPRNPRTWNNRGIILHAMNRGSDAIVDIQKALELNPKYVDALRNLGIVNFAMGQFDQAIAAHSKAIALEPNDAWTYINRGSAKNGLGRSADAEKDFLKAIQIDNRIAESYVGLSTIYLGRDDLPKAFKYANSAVEKHPTNAMALNQRGLIHYKLSKFTEAMYDFDRSIRFGPNFPITYSNRGICLADLQKYDRAIQDFSRALKLMPDSAVAFASRGFVYLKTGDFKNALSDFEKSYELAPKLGEASRGLAWYYATCSDEKLRDGKKALRFAKIACELGEWTDWQQLDSYAAALAESGSFDEATKWAEKSIELAPGPQKKAVRQRLELYKQQKAYRG